jgi:hypothetical protein
MYLAFWDDFSISQVATIRLKHVSGCSPVIQWGKSSVGMVLLRVRARGLPDWSRHPDDPILASNITRPIDFILFMAYAPTNDERIQAAPALVGRHTLSARKAEEDEHCLLKKAGTVRLQ